MDTETKVATAAPIPAMTKAFDPQNLFARLKARGLNVTEDALKGIVEDVYGWSGDSVKLTPTLFDDAVFATVGGLKAAAIAEIDKLDGEVG